MFALIPSMLSDTGLEVRLLQTTKIIQRERYTSRDKSIQFKTSSVKYDIFLSSIIWRRKVFKMNQRLTNKSRIADNNIVVRGIKIKDINNNGITVTFCWNKGEDEQLFKEDH